MSSNSQIVVNKNEKSLMKLFNASLNSLELRESLKSESLEISELLIENYFDFIHISLARVGKQYSGWFIHDFDEDDDDDEDRITVGDTAFLNHEKEGDQLHLYHENRFIGALALMKYIFENVCSGSIKSSTFLIGTEPNPKIYDFLVESFKMSSVAQCANLMLWEKRESSKTMVDQILELAVGVQRLDFRCEMPDDWRNQKILKIPTLLSWPSEWFTTTDLMMNLECEVANINETNLKWQSFKAFLLKWQNIENPGKLKMLEVSFDGNWDGWQLDGLNIIECDANQRDTHFPDLLKGLDEPWQSMRVATDIQRADGLIGSFWRRENSFHFVVWHDPHPIATWQPNEDLLVELGDEQLMSSEEDEDE